VDDTLKRRIAETWAHYVELARQHRAGRYPLQQGQWRDAVCIRVPRVGVSSFFHNGGCDYFCDV